MDIDDSRPEQFRSSVMKWMKFAVLVTSLNLVILIVNYLNIAKCIAGYAK